MVYFEQCAYIKKHSSTKYLIQLFINLHGITKSDEVERSLMAKDTLEGIHP